MMKVLCTSAAGHSKERQGGTLLISWSNQIRHRLYIRSFLSSFGYTNGYMSFLSHQLFPNIYHTNLTQTVRLWILIFH